MKLIFKILFFISITFSVKAQESYFNTTKPIIKVGKEYSLKLIPFYQNGKWGYLNSDKEIVYNSLYDTLPLLYKNSNNNIFTKREKQSCTLYIPDSIQIYFKSVKERLNSLGFSSIKEITYHDNLLYTEVKYKKLDGKILEGVLDKNYRFIIPLQEGVIVYNYDHWMIVKDSLIKIFTIHGNLIKEGINLRNEMTSYKNNVSIIKTPNGYGIVDTSGNEILPFIYNFIRPINDNFLEVKQGEYSLLYKYTGKPYSDIKYKVLDRIKDEYSDDEYIKFITDSLFGFMNKSGEVFLKDKQNIFYLNGKVWLKENGALILSNGETIFGGFNNYGKYAYRDGIEFYDDNKTGFISNDGVYNFKIGDGFLKFQSINDTIKIITFKYGKFLYNNGKRINKILNANYELLNDTCLLIDDNDLLGIANLSGEILIKPISKKDFYSKNSIVRSGGIHFIKNLNRKDYTLQKDDSGLYTFILDNIKYNYKYGDSIIYDFKYYRTDSLVLKIKQGLYAGYSPDSIQVLKHGRIIKLPLTIQSIEQFKINSMHVFKLKNKYGSLSFTSNSNINVSFFKNISYADINYKEQDSVVIIQYKGKINNNGIKELKEFAINTKKTIIYSEFETKVSNVISAKGEVVFKKNFKLPELKCYEDFLFKISRNDKTYFADITGYEYFLK